MDLSTAAGHLAPIPLVAATLSAFLIGGLWYGPLFGRAWMSANGFVEADLKARNMPRIFALSLVLIFIATLNLEMFVGPKASMGFGFLAGLLAGLGWVATLLGVIYLFEKRPFMLWCINAGYSVVALSVIGGILGLL